MTAPHTSRAPWKFNQLLQGATYLATTRHRMVVGEYLGMESPYGDRAILLRNGTETASIALVQVTSIQAVAA
jgi:hypothetical protein